MVTPALFVDDLSAENAAPEKWIVIKLGGVVAEGLKASKVNSLELSD